MPKRILYLEDDLLTRTAMINILRREGYETLAYSSAEAAHHHIKAADFDAAILDVRLPGRFGDDFGTELRQFSPKAQIIFLTAEETIETIKERIPGALVIRKPVDIAVLLELLRCHDTT
jgi:DNA-binding response OmpR family regulator